MRAVSWGSWCAVDLLVLIYPMCHCRSKVPFIAPDARFRIIAWMEELVSFTAPLASKLASKYTRNILSLKLYPYLVFYLQLCQGISWTALWEKICEHRKLWTQDERQISYVPSGHGPLPMSIGPESVSILSPQRGWPAQKAINWRKEGGKKWEKTSWEEFTSQGGI